MGLLSTEVEVGLTGKNISYYENKGYKIPRIKHKYRSLVPRQAKITVNVNDLSYGSGVIVDVNCDLCGKEYQEKYNDYNKHNYDGKCYCRSCANKLFNSGENNGKYNPNKTDEERIRKREYTEYDVFVQKVLARDNYTCRISGQNGNDVDLEVHHLDSYDWCVEKRTDVTNGITLSKDIHKAFHTIYGYGKNTKQQFLEFIKKYDLLLEDYNGEIPTSRWIYCVNDNEIIKNIGEYVKTNKVAASCIYSCCNNKFNKYNKKIYLWYDIYEKMSDEELRLYINKCEANGRTKRVVCVNYNLLFESAKSAGTYFNIDPPSITKCCKGKVKCAGESINEEKLVWRYVSDIEDIDNYTMIADEDIYNRKIKCDYPCKIDYANKIVCVEYRTFFSSIINASKYYDIDRKSIEGAIKGKFKTAGKDIKTKKKLHWMRGDAYIERYEKDELIFISKEECEKAFLSRNQESSSDGSFIM